MVSNSFMFSTDKIDHSHIPEMHDGKRQCDLSGHRADTTYQFCPGSNGLPCADHKRSITEIEQIITDKKDIINGIGQFLISM